MISGDLVISFLIWTINFWINSPIEIPCESFWSVSLYPQYPQRPDGIQRRRWKIRKLLFIGKSTINGGFKMQPEDNISSGNLA